MSINEEKDMTTTTLHEDADGAPYPEHVQQIWGQIKDTLFEEVGLTQRSEQDHESADEVTAAIMEKVVLPALTAAMARGAKSLLTSLLDSGILSKEWVIGGPPDAYFVRGRLGKPMVDVSVILKEAGDE